jgi:hypothetical protein
VSKLILAGLVALTLGLFAAFADDSASSVSADEGRSDAVQFAQDFCREADEEGLLEEMGITFGECINFVTGPASEEANNYIAGICGAEIIQARVGATDKGQCIKIVKELL